MENELNILNPDLKFQKVALIAPTKSHYLLVAAEIDHSPLPFFLTTSNKKKHIIEQAKKCCAALRKEKYVLSAVVFKARLIPPGRGKFLEKRKDKVHIAKFDVAVLVETTSLESIEMIKSSSAFKETEKEIKRASTYTEIIQASNIKRINSVKHHKQGVFLFNYFYADRLQQNLDVWEYTAGWFQQETGLDNSTVLLPTDSASTAYTIINHCRWDKMTDILPSLLFKKSFRSYVLDHFYANNVAAMPVLYKMV